MPRLLLIALCVFGVLCGESPAAEPTYWQDVRPILRRNCTVCHKESKLAEKDVSAGLALDSPELIRKTAKPAVLTPGKPDASLLVTLLTHADPKRRMPLDADPLPPETVAVVRRWVELGCPEGTKSAEAEPATAVAASRPVRKLPVAFATKLAIPNVKGAVDFTLPVGPLPPVAAVAFSPDGKLLATGSYGRVTVWDLGTGEPAKVLTSVLGAVNDLKFSPNGSLLAVAGGQPSARGDLRLFDTKAWKLVHSLGGHLDTVSGVSFSPDGSKLLSASFDKTVRLWDVKSAKVLDTFTGHSDFVYAVAFAPNGEWYATASKDRSSRLVEVATGKSRFTFSGNDQEVLAVAVSPDGKQVVTSGLDAALAWWNLETGERINRRGGHGTATHELAFAAKGAFLASGGADKTVRTTNPATAGEVKSYPQASAVFAVAVDPAAKRIAAGCADGLARVWDAASGRLLVTLWSGAGDGDLGGWLAQTPEGYYAADPTLAAKMTWRAAGKPLPDAKPLAPMADAALVAKAARGEAVPDPAMK